jgi:hypothetical protein
MAITKIFSKPIFVDDKSKLREKLFLSLIKYNKFSLDQQKIYIYIEVYRL